MQWAQDRAAPGLSPFVVVNTGERKVPPLHTALLLTFKTEPHFYEHGPVIPAAKVAAVLTLVLQNLYFLPQRALRVQLGGLRDIIRNVANPLSTYLVDSIPKKPQTCSAHFNLDAIVAQYLCCPSCHRLYPYEPSHVPQVETPLFGPEAPIPSHCTYNPTKGQNPCGTPLWKERRITGDKVVLTPIRKYYHHDLKSWMGRLLAHKGIEEHLESRPSQRPTTDIIDDIWVSDVFLNLKDHSGNKFYPGPINEGRLVFSLSVDSFDPLGNKTAKQSLSSTGIWLVLLNLPRHLRYQPENLYLAGVIPHKPSTYQINHYLELIVKDFLELWHPGVFFSRTRKHRLGKLFKAMLVPVVCDMLAARQVIGYANSPTSHYFCTLCDLDIHDILVLDRRDWPKKDLADIRRFATLWRDAETERDRDSIFEAFGWRWSPLFDLPYFNPTLFTVVDSMHTLDLGVLQHHCRELFGIDVKHIGGGTSPHSSPATKQVLSDDFQKLRKCHKSIKANGVGMLYELLKFDRRELYTICVYYDIRGERNKVVGTRWLLAKQINAWVKSALLHFLCLMVTSSLTHPATTLGRPFHNG